MNELKTYRQWMREGRTVQQGEKARAYLLNDERSTGAPMFAEEQTTPNGGVDQHDTWTIVVTPQEYFKIRDEARKLRKIPMVRVDKANAGGVSVWVGPNKQAIGWLKDAGYHFSPTSHRWLHKDKDAEQVADAWAAWGYRVTREWDGAPIDGRPVI